MPNYRRAPCGPGKKRRLLAIAICAVFVAVYLLSQAFVLTCSNHRHDHDGVGGTCAACARVAASGKLLLAAGAVVFVAGFLSLVFAVSRVRLVAAYSSTPVRLKVRLNI
jgi:hypothetical protein